MRVTFNVPPILGKGGPTVKAPTVKGFAGSKDEWEQPISTPQSSNVGSARYNPGDRQLEITFRSGGVYLYENVPREVFVELVNSDSPGKFVKIGIKNRFISKRVT